MAESASPARLHGAFAPPARTQSPAVCQLSLGGPTCPRYSCCSSAPHQWHCLCGCTSPETCTCYTLQECVVQWHEQKIPHGLVVAPPILFVSLARYASIARGKNPIRLPCKAVQKVSFPVFRGSDHDITWASYTLVAGIMHLGPRPQSGHYRSFLAHPGSHLESWPLASTPGSTEPRMVPAGDRGLSAPSGRPPAPLGSRQYTWWCTDDEKPAEVCHPTYYRTLSENCYVLCFCLTEHLSTC